MAKSRPGKKAQARAAQLQLPGMPPPLPPGTTRVLPMQLQVGDRLADETGEGEPDSARRLVQLAVVARRPEKKRSPRALVIVPGWVANIDLLWDEPHVASFLERLASFLRLILLDKRGDWARGSRRRHAESGNTHGPTSGP